MHNYLPVTWDPCTSIQPIFDCVCPARGMAGGVPVASLKTAELASVSHGSGIWDCGDLACRQAGNKLNPNQVMPRAASALGERSWASDGRNLVGGYEVGECVVEESPEGPVGTLSLRGAGLPPPPPPPAAASTASSPPHPLRRFQILKILTGKIVVGHAIHNDFKALQYFHPKSLTRDTSHIPPLNRKADCPENATMSLKTLTKKLLNRDIQVATPQMLPGPRGREWGALFAASLQALAPESPWTATRAGRPDGKSLAQRGPVVSPPVCGATVPVLCRAVSWGWGGVWEREHLPVRAEARWERETAHRAALRARGVGIWVSCVPLARGEGRPAWQEGGHAPRGEVPDSEGPPGIWNIVCGERRAARHVEAAAGPGAGRSAGLQPCLQGPSGGESGWGSPSGRGERGPYGFMLLSPSRVQVGKSGHSSVEDAQAAMELYKLVEVEWEQHLAQSPPKD